MILEENYKELDEVELVGINGGSCCGGCSSSGGGSGNSLSGGSNYGYPTISDGDKTVISINANKDKKYILTGDINTDYRCDNWVQEVLSDYYQKIK